MLCERCSVLRIDDTVFRTERTTNKSLFLEVEPNDKYGNKIHRLKLDFEHNDTYPELPGLARSSAEGCNFCTFLRKVIGVPNTRAEIEGKLDESKRSNVIIELSYMWTNNHMPERIGLDALQISYKFGVQTIAVWCALEALPDHAKVQNWLGLAPALKSDHLAEDNLLWIKSMLQDCEQHNHRTNKAYVLPTRLIDVTGCQARLVLGSDVATNHPAPTYAALSYCWGTEMDSKDQLKTTRASMGDRMSGINDVEMTAVLRDAIRATRALDLPYLWVDALCILQDDKADWDTECAVMDHVFSNAYVTLCALASDSCHDGFLERQMPSESMQVPFESKLNLGISGAFNVRYMIPDRVPFPTPLPLRYDLNVGRWDTRGWVYQEKAMSTRMLLFGASDVHFTCLSFHESRSRRYRRNKRPYMMNFRNLEKPGTGGNDKWSDPYALWAEMIRDFTRVSLPVCSDRLTIATDALPALSGLASSVQPFIPDDQYVAGLWKKDLYQSLAWGIEHSLKCYSVPSHEQVACGVGFEAWMQKVTIQDPYIAPSWSWVRHNKVQAKTYEMAKHKLWANFKPAYERLDAIARPKDRRNPFGEVTVARIQLTTKCRALFEPTQAQLQHSALISVGTHVVTDWCGQLAISPEHSNKLVMALLGSFRSALYMFHGQDPSFSEEDESTQPDAWRSVYGILLYPTATPDRYYRVGTWWSEMDGIGGMRLFRQCSVRTVEVI